MSDTLREAAALLTAGRIEDAARHLDEARRAAPLRADLAFGQGVVASDAGRPKDAIRYLRETLALLPSHALAMTSLAGFLVPAHAVRLLARLTRLEPGDPSNWIRFSHSLREAHAYGAALLAAQSALAFRPMGAAALGARGAAFHTLGRLEDAGADVAAALAFAPAAREHWINLSLVLNEASLLDAAEAAMDRALNLAPGLGDAEWGVALIRWLKGDLLGAWRSFDGRLDRRGIVRGDIAAVPRWRGEDFPGRTLLLWAEQGQGDTLQFIRYYDAIKARGGRVIIEVQPSLKRLFDAQNRFDAVYARGEIGEGFDLQMAMMSAPVVFATTRQTIPYSGPYLHAADDFALPERPGLKVGLVWAGNPDNATADRVRSFDLETYDPLFDLDGVAFYALQLGARAAGLRTRPNLVDLAPRLTDFAATAAAIARLDLLITSCTSVPHLAGAMGKPVWLVLNKAGEYRWGLASAVTPWYPTMRIYRQTQLRDWSAPISAIRADLADMVDRALRK